MNEADIPIDIHTGKLLDWLISRRHVKKDWQKGILPIREKINNAIQDMPVHEGIAKLLSGSHINYFHCLKIIDILKETEADSKNLFGRYGSQRMKDWQEIAKMYEKDNIYLAEAAQLLIRNVNYEVPSLKKQLTKIEQSQTECDKKVSDYAKREAACRAEFNTVCKQIGIVGEKIKAELVEKVKELPEIYEKIGQKMSSLKPAIQLYTAFTRCIVGEPQSQCCVPLVKFIVEQGNTTVYEWSFGEPPLRVEPDPIHIDLDVDAENEATEKIDFGDGVEIDFGDGVEIDFGGTSEVIDFGEDLGKGDDIDWGAAADADDSKISYGDIDVNISLEESGIVVEGGGTLGGVATGKDALTLLDNPATRASFIDQMMELEAFLKMRLYEISTDTQYSTFSSLQDLPIESTDSITAMLDLVQITVGEMTEKKINHLHNIKHSPRYVDTLSAQLKQKLSICNKMVALSEAVTLKKGEVGQQSKEVHPVLSLIIQKTRELQHEIEQDISKKYNNRPVNIMGGVKAM